MDTVNIALTVIGSLGGIAVIAKLFIKAVEMKTKVDALWSVYEVRLIEIAKREGIGQSSSIIKLTEKGEGLLTEEIKEEIKEIVLKPTFPTVNFPSVMVPQHKTRYTRLLFTPILPISTTLL